MNDIRCAIHDEIYPIGMACKLCLIGDPSKAEIVLFLASTQTKYLVDELEKRGAWIELPPRKEV